MPSDKQLELESKLLILCLLKLIELPVMSRAQITDFVIGNNLMNHFVLETNLADLLEKGMLYADYINAEDASTTQYAITDMGLEHLELLSEHISTYVRKLIRQYVAENRSKLRQDLDKTALYFFNPKTGEYIVKCGVYDDKNSSLLMEVAVSVVSREQAKQIRANWNSRCNEMYINILTELMKTPSVPTP